MDARPPVWSVVRRARAARGLIAGLALAVGAWVLVRTSVRRVAGSSMTPTLGPGDLIVMVPVRADRLVVDDIVVVRDPREPARETIKRVVGLPGDLTDLGGEVAPVPAGHVAVAGDNRFASTDSRRYGAVPVSAVEGRAVARLVPPGRLP